MNHRRVHETTLFHTKLSIHKSKLRVFHWLLYLITVCLLLASISSSCSAAMMGGGGGMEVERGEAPDVDEDLGEDGGDPEILNHRPTAHIDFITPNPAAFGETIRFKGHGTDPDINRSFPGGGDYIAGGKWRSSIDGNLTPEKCDINKTLLSLGTHIIYFQVVDSHGNWSEEVTYNDSLIIHHAPVANASGPYFGRINESLSFDASASYDDGSIAKCIWSFGDGSTKQGVKPTHTYSDPDVYTVTLTVTDNYNATDTMETKATIVGYSPLADAGGPYFGYVDDLLVFDGSNSSDPDGSIISYVWDFGDGSDGSGMITNHTYTSNGTYTVQLRVTDDDGKTDVDSTTIVIVVGTSPPSIPQLDVTMSATDPATASVSAVSVDANDDMIRYIFNWGDDTTTTTPFFPSGTLTTATHTWPAAGEYVITVYAEDASNETSEITEVTVTIEQPSESDSNNEHSGTPNQSSKNEEEQRNALILLGLSMGVFSLLGCIAVVFRKHDSWIL